MQSQKSIKWWMLIGGGTAIAAVLLLLLTGHRVLIFEKRIEPGKIYVVPGWGDLGKASQTQLVCRYFTGRSITTNVLWYSPNNIMGRDQCPFFVSE